MKTRFVFHLDVWKIVSFLGTLIGIAVLFFWAYLSTSCTPRTYVIKAKAEKIELDYQDQIHPKSK